MAQKKTTNQNLVDAVIERLKQDFAENDYTVLEGALQNIPNETLIHSLPEEDWKKFPKIIPSTV